MFSSWYSWVSD